MAATTMNNPLGWHVLSESNGTLSRETVTVASGAGLLQPGMVLGKVTATGKYLPYDNAATDGTQSAAAVLFAEVNAASADVKAVVHVRHAEVWNSRLLWKSSNAAADKTAGLADLAALGLYAR